jgi:hypothetical protein
MASIPDARSSSSRCASAGASVGAAADSAAI